MTETRDNLPPDHPQRRALHQEIHARAPARIRVPACITYVAVLHSGITPQQELEHLQRLNGTAHLQLHDLADHFVRLRGSNHVLRWERHTEYSRYLVISSPAPDGGWHCPLPEAWMANIPGRTLAAIRLRVITPNDVDETPQQAFDALRQDFGNAPIVASLVDSDGSSSAATDFVLREDGYVHMTVRTGAQEPRTRVGRIVQRLLELETYRLMALIGLQDVRRIGTELGGLEHALGEVSALLESGTESHGQLLQRHMAMAAQLERLITQTSYRFAATAAYDALVRQRIEELHERVIPGAQPIGEYVNRRLAPASATVASTARRLHALSERVGRANTLLRAHVDIATEQRSQALLEKLTQGQRTQLRMQMTVEGLSIAAISYYVTSLIEHGAEALHLLGLPVQPGLVAGAMLPLVVLGVWLGVRKLHRLMTHDDPEPPPH